MPYTDPAKHRANARKWRDNNLERSKARIAAWRLKNPKKLALSQRKARFKSRYGITLEQYEQMFEAQGKVCAICKTEPKRLVVDHNHATKKIRGLLCHPCNIAIGLMLDNANSLLNAAKYLEDHSGTG